MAAAVPEEIAAFARTAHASVDLAVSPACARAQLGDIARFGHWLSMHVTFRGAPPRAAVEGDTFAEQVMLMGIPADVSWTVTRADDRTLVLHGTGPMGLTIALCLAVEPRGEGCLVRIHAGIGGDPVRGPVGATVARSVQDAMTESLENFVALTGEAPEEEPAGRYPSGTVLHERTGRRLDPRTPVVVGAGQVVRRKPDLENLPDPVALSAEALRRAGDDSGVGDALLAAADAVYAVASASWTYRDQAALVAAAVGASPRETVVSAPYGGDAGQALVNTAGQAIIDGEADVVLVSGAEVGSTLAAAQKQGIHPAWPEQDAVVAPTRVIGSDREANNGPESAAGLTVPVYTYALMESAIRASVGESPDEHRRTITELWAGLSRVAAGNEYAWDPHAYTAEELATASDRNRMIAEPYPKLLCANLQVDLAGALVLTSVAAAEALGVPQDKWVFLHAGAAAYDEWFVSERADLAASPAIREIGAVALAHAGRTIDEIAHVDLYSCFPAAVQIAARELGLPINDPDRPLSVTGGLTFAGGPGNNYGTHAVATLVGRLRRDPEALGLSTSLGWFVTKHALGIYSATPPERPGNKCPLYLCPQNHG